MLREDALATHARHLDWASQANRAAVETGREYLKMALAANAGAPVAVLTFLGSTTDKAKLLEAVHALQWPLLLYAVGIAAAVAAMGLSWVTGFLIVEAAHARTLDWQHPFVHETEKAKYMHDIRSFFQWGTIAIGVVPNIVFLVASIWMIVTLA